MTTCRNGRSALTIDHIVLAASTLEQGIAYLRERIGVAPSPGGAHPAMGTHNAVLKLGDRLYLEVIAIDLQADPPSRPRWMALDDPAMRALLEKEPRLVCWMAATADIEGMAARFAPLVGEVWHGARGDLRWRLTVRADGSLPAGGALPSLIQWPENVHPANVMPDLGFRFRSLTVRHRAAAWLAASLEALGARDGVTVAEARGIGPLLELAIEGNGRSMTI